MLSSGRYGTYEISQVQQNGRSLLVHIDYDFVGLARSFGWNMRSPKCVHSHTDGTIDCPDCGKTVLAFISEASAYLDRNEGKEIDDPGYFA